MTYGSATVAENVEAYFKSIYGDKASKEVIEDFKERYRLVGHSPLIEITEAQAEALQKELGSDYVVRAGMRHSSPTIADAIKECRDAGATKLLGIVLSPQFSSFIMDGYMKTFAFAAKENEFDTEHSTVVGPWPTEPHFIDMLANKVEKSLTELKEKFGTDIPVIFTTHSLPQRVVDQDPSYLEQLAATISAVHEKLDSQIEWYSGYQSAGHTPEKWLKPDLTDILAQLAEKKSPAILIVPIQFLADHLEVLYDLDIAARKQCEDFGIAYNRIELPNTDPLFIQALASIATEAAQTLTE